MLRNKFRFSAVIMIISLISLLVLLLVAMAEGLAVSSKQYIENIDAELILFRDDVDISIPASFLGRSKLNDIKRVEGVTTVGPIGFSTASILLNRGAGSENLDVTLIGVEPGMPGAPPVFDGVELSHDLVEEVIIDRHVLDKVNIPLGSTLDLKVLQGTEEKIYSLRVIGYTEGQKYLFLPSIFVPLRVWDKIKPQEKPDQGGPDLIFNVAAVKLENPDAWPEMIEVIERQVNRVEVTDPVSTYEATQGYKDMQTIVNTEQNFILLVALLVIGGFFQIQTLQKVAQIGMLKAIGASNRLIALTLTVQVVLTSTIGMIMGGFLVWGLTFV
jgi:putative ABC transport system permease protein